AIFIVFFFQAEDGIRDLIVTGVQTCALPILEYGAGWPEGNSPNPARTGSSRAKMKKRVQNCVAALFVWLMAVPVAPAQSSVSQRSEERRVGNEGRARGRRAL